MGIYCNNKVEVIPVLNKRIKERRLQLQMSQEELAAKTGYQTKGAISRIENGTRDISQSQISEFANALHTTESYLMGWTDNVENKSNTPTLTPQEQNLLDNYNNSNNTGKKIIIDTSDTIARTYPKKPTRQEMIDYIRSFRRAAYNGATNPFDMTDDELEEKYYQYKEDFGDD